MKVGMIGTGLQAKRRAPVLAQSREDSLTAVCSGNPERAKAFAAQYGTKAYDSWQDLVADSALDAVIITSPPDSHRDMTVAALKAGKHVLVEKPLSMTLAEGEEMVAAAKAANRVLKCGFNHRHHPALLDAKKAVDDGRLGKLMIGRCRYGLCGRTGYEKEWRGDTNKAAGGHLMELGIHGIDLFRWFFGEVEQIAGMTGTQYFPMAPLEDNGMAMLRHAGGGICSIHSSLTEWKNLFSFEVFGTEGYLMVEGLGASYGTEKLYVGKRDFSAPFQDVVTEYRGADKSWQLEWEEFAAAIKAGREPLGSGVDGLEALRVVFAAYASQKDGRMIAPSAVR